MSSPLPPRSNQPKAESANSPVSSDAEKDSYTLDEMMKALRDGERERESTSEVVTRSDGSVVHRVKRRKRRSDQPEKTKSERATPEKKKKRFLIVFHSNKNDHLGDWVCYTFYITTITIPTRKVRPFPTDANARR